MTVLVGPGAWLRASAELCGKYSGNLALTRTFPQPVCLATVSSHRAGAIVLDGEQGQRLVS